MFGNSSDVAMIKIYRSSMFDNSSDVAMIKIHEYVW